MGFPGFPDNLFEDFDWTGFQQSVVDSQLAFVNTLDDETLNRLGKAVDGYEESARRTKRVLAIAHGFLSRGIALAAIL